MLFLLVGVLSHQQKQKRVGEEVGQAQGREEARSDLSGVVVGLLHLLLAGVELEMSAEVSNDTLSGRMALYERLLLRASSTLMIMMLARGLCVYPNAVRSLFTLCA